MHEWFEKRDALMRRRRDAREAVEAVWTLLAAAGPAEARGMIERLQAANAELWDLERRFEDLIVETSVLTAPKGLDA